MSEFKMPSLGADMESAVLMEWLVKEGDRVTKGQVIAEVETSKGIIEIEVFEDGIIEKILVETETECTVGAPLALIRSEGESVAEVEAEPMAEIAPESEPQPSEPSEPEPFPGSEKVSRMASTEKHIQASPAARKRAKELGVDLAILASKIEGKIRIKQVESAAETKDKVSVVDGMRQAIAAAMSRSNREIPHYYLSTSINMTPSLQWLEKQNSNRTIQERILPVVLLIRAVVRALGEIPELNGFWQGDTHQVSKVIHPGIAIALRKGGVVTPALLNAQGMNLDETMQALSDLISRARAGKLRNAEVTQQTVTITNLGDLGVERVYGVIYPPQVALVGLGRIMDTPWAEDDALMVRKVMQATIAGDHRATDGRTGALFLEKLNQFLQKPEELL